MQRSASAQSRQSCVRMDRQYSLHLWAQLTMRYFRRYFRRVLLAWHSKWNAPRDLEEVGFLKFIFTLDGYCLHSYQVIMKSDFFLRPLT